MIDGSIAESSSSPTVPPVAASEANSSGGVVRKSHHHHGRGIALTIVPSGELRRNREAVALVAQARAGDGGVDGEHQGVEAGGRRALDEPVRDLALAHHVELEPVATVGVRGLDVLDGRRAERRQRERDARGRGRAGAGDLALGLHQAGEAGGRDAEGHRATCRRGSSSWCRPSTRRAGSTGGTRCPRTPAARERATARPRRRRRCSRTRPWACGASRSSCRS